MTNITKKINCNWVRKVICRTYTSRDYIFKQTVRINIYLWRGTPDDANDVPATKLQSTYRISTLLLQYVIIFPFLASTNDSSGSGTRVSKFETLCSGDVGYVTWRSLSNIYRDPPSYQISIISRIFSFSMLFLFLYLQERSRSYFPARRWSPYRTAPWQNNQRGPVALQQFFLWKSLKLSFRLHKKFPWFIDLEMITFIYI